MSDKAYLPYLKTLRRIPRPIVQAMATRGIISSWGDVCLCGWAIREALAFANGHTADEINVWDNNNPNTEFPLVVSLCQRNFGGTAYAWESIYYGIVRKPRRAIEEAFARRVAECVR